MQAASLVSRDPAVESAISTVNDEAGGQIFLHLKPLKEGRRDVDEIIDELRNRLAQVPGFRVHLRKLGAGPLRYVLTSADFGTLEQWMHKVEEKLRTLPGVRDVSDDFHSGIDSTVNIDRARASGIPTSRIETVLSILRGNHRISNEPPVILELQRRYQEDPGTLSKLSISGEDDKLVRLDTLAKLEVTRGLREVNHFGLSPSVTISFDLRPGANIDKAIAEIHLPPTVKGIWVKN
jgi:HAE1 family hydrophobic/amphiphilic exporter-1